MGERAPEKLMLSVQKSCLWYCPGWAWFWSSVPPTLEEGSASLVGFIVQNKQNPKVWASHWTWSGLWFPVSMKCSFHLFCFHLGFSLVFWNPQSWTSASDVNWEISALSVCACINLEFPYKRVLFSGLKFKFWKASVGLHRSVWDEGTAPADLCAGCTAVQW